MTYSVYQVDAFTTSIFKGNPACVVPLDKWLEDEILLNIAKERRLIFNVGHGLTPDCKIDNVKKVINIVRNYKR